MSTDQNYIGGNISPGREIARFFDRQDIPLRGSSLLVALSGGLDSVVLVTALDRLRAETPCLLTLGHVNHHLRAESDDDEKYCQGLADRLGLELRVAHLDPTERRQTSVEGWARDERYHALGRMADQAGAQWILTGHHADDQVETVLMRLRQGASLMELAGIRPIRGRLLRPLLEVSRQQLRDWADRAALQWVEDPSNRDERYLRNHLRHTVLPRLLEESPESRATLLGVARLARQYEGQITADAAQLLTGAQSGSLPGTVSFAVDTLTAAEDEVVAQAVRQLGETEFGTVVNMSRAHWQSFRHFVRVAGTGKVFELVNDVKALKDREAVVFYTSGLEKRPEPAPLIEGLNRWGQHEIVARPVQDHDPGSPHFMARSWQPGDRAPSGHARGPLLSDLFINAKLNRLEKIHWPLVTGMTGELLWLPGLGTGGKEWQEDGWRLSWQQPPQA